ncbi:MAG: hypothetical protein IH859_01685 [Chloroflexi bacterium]|nr:hypothetical protein [Chloroflexota bacterium]
MKRLTYTGSFWPLALMAELQSAGVQVITVNGDVQREPGQIIAASQVTISVPDSQPVPPVDSAVAAHNPSATMAAERTVRLRISQNTISAAAKLRIFYIDTVGLTDEEIDDSNILER